MLLTSNHLEKIARHKPVQRAELSLMRAAVTIILRDGDNGTEFLLMQRAKHPQDPWSGQMSFPGGKIDPGDRSAQAAAVREAFEEVGLALNEDDYVGRLDDLYGLKVDNQYSVHVAIFVYKIQQPVDLVGNHEVADLVWLPFAWLHDPANEHDYPHPHSTDLMMPAVLIDDHKEQILWGLSLRMISMLYGLLELELPILSSSRQPELAGSQQYQMEPKDREGLTRQVLNRGSE